MLGGASGRGYADYCLNIVKVKSGSVPPIVRINPSEIIAGVAMVPTNRSYFVGHHPGLVPIFMPMVLVVTTMSPEQAGIFIFPLKFWFLPLTIHASPGADAGASCIHPLEPLSNLITQYPVRSIMSAAKHRDDDRARRMNRKRQTNRFIDRAPLNIIDLAK